MHQEVSMSAPSNLTVEAHRSAATVYASGDLTTAAVLRAIATVEQLPPHVRAICVDLRGVRRTDSRALRTLEAFLCRWRAARRGMSRVTLAEHASTSLVGIKFAHKRWTSVTTAVGAS
jgi:ABC-type transporter Mla MlaB component